METGFTDFKKGSKWKTLPHYLMDDILEKTFQLGTLLLLLNNLFTVVHQR